MEIEPFFSIIVPTYNRAHLIGKTIASITAQTFHNFEVIIVDDGSKDATEEAVQQYLNNNIHYYKKENEERSIARNYGWDRAIGKYVTFLDSDDVLFPDHFQTAYDTLKEYNFPECYAQAYEIKDSSTDSVIVHGFKSKSSIINKYIIKGNVLSCFGVFLKRKIGAELQFEKDRRSIGCEDWLLWLQLAARYPFYYNSHVTGAMIQHEERSVMEADEQRYINSMEFLKFKLLRDPQFLKRFKKQTVRRIYAHMMTYSSLHLAMGKQKKKSVYYLLKAAKYSFSELLSVRTLAIIKKLLLS